MAIDIMFTTTQYVIIHGQLVSGENLLGTYTWEWMKVTNPTQLTTSRQFVCQFANYPDMVDYTQENFPEQLENIPEEEMM
jgi:hypothetical protein